MNANSQHSTARSAEHQSGHIRMQPSHGPRTGWAERLAAWAERQPSHRRLGCWTAS